MSWLGAQPKKEVKMTEGYQLEGLESLALREGRSAEGCNHLEAVKIARAAKGNGPNWYVREFVPKLSPETEAKARLLILKNLAGDCALWTND
jgi:hypothetical protein